MAEEARSRPNSQLLDITPVPTNQTATTTSSVMSNLHCLSAGSSTYSLESRSSMDSLPSEPSPEAGAEDQDDQKKLFGFRFRLFNKKLNFSLDRKKSQGSGANGDVNEGANGNVRMTRRKKSRDGRSKRRNRSKTSHRSYSGSGVFREETILEMLEPLSEQALHKLLTKNAASWTGDFMCDLDLANTIYTTPVYFVPQSTPPTIRIVAGDSPAADGAESSSPVPFSNVEGDIKTIPVPSTSQRPVSLESKGSGLGEKEPISPRAKSVIHRLDFNQVSSANPVEDRYSRTHILGPDGKVRWHLIGIYDGHSGHQTSDYIAQHLPKRIAQALQTAFDPDTPSSIGVSSEGSGVGLSHSLATRCSITAPVTTSKPLPPTPDGTVPSDPIEEPDIGQILTDCFVAMDHEIVHQALHRFMDQPNKSELLFPAIAGSCAVLACVDEVTREVFIAHCGDSRALLGVQKPAPKTRGSTSATTTPTKSRHQGDDGTLPMPNGGEPAISGGSSVPSWYWKAIQITRDHNAAIEVERSRLAREHPADGQPVVSSDRVLGVLAVTRAFGDASFKWHRHLVQSIYPGLFPDKKCPDPLRCISPPYITARPDIKRWKLRPQDRFLVLASDGLFEGLTNELVAELVGGFYEQQIHSDPDSISGSGTRSENNVKTPTSDNEDELSASPTEAFTIEPVLLTPNSTTAGQRELRTAISPPLLSDINYSESDPEDRFNFMVDDPTYIPTDERRQFLDTGLKQGEFPGDPIYQVGDVQYDNAATLLIDNTFSVISRQCSGSLLALQAPESSNYRDDVTAAVLFF
ncbi:hypothetical protein IWQ61_001362 [Dispira simplex]|nr:hypothetical protein IWQ61_001362 [Dispira simplex]